MTVSKRSMNHQPINPRIFMQIYTSMIEETRNWNKDPLYSLNIAYYNFHFLLKFKLFVAISRRYYILYTHARTHIYVYIGRKIFLIITRVSRDRYRHVVFEKVIKKNNKINKSVLRSLEDSWQDKKKGKNEKKRKEKEKNKLNHPTFATRN